TLPIEYGEANADQRASDQISLQASPDGRGFHGQSNGHNAVVRAVILAGGRGTRLAEETELRPKPMVEIGGRPILWHIMKHYARYGFNEFVLALGYKGDQIKRYFLDYHAVGQD